MNDSRSKIWLSESVKPSQPNKIQNHQKHQNNPGQIGNKSNTRGDVWDQINLKEMLKSEHKKLYQRRSKFQKIHVLEAKEIRMFLDEQLQFSSLDERIYHEAFVHIPMALTKSRDRILILGGGDGLALREVLKYSDVKHVDLVDIDPEVLSIARNVPEIVSLNERSLFDQRVNIHAEDARDFLKTNKGTYDLMIIDFPDPADPELASLYSLELFQMLSRYLAKDGKIVCQAISPEDTPIVFWSIGLTMERAGFYTESYHTIVPSFGDWGFQLASKVPFSTQFKKITVPYRTLPTNLASLFHFKSEILAYKTGAIVNNLSNPQLHTIYREEIVDPY
ncbi:spermidine synthase [Bacillus sp. JJ1562]|uniref:spermine/spermidine synthase domain-containing protein n=1 Tax=Bacillus sp. JJ1562 TaxID=3122960 RepID=UPI00300262BB